MGREERARTGREASRLRGVGHIWQAMCGADPARIEETSTSRRSCNGSLATPANLLGKVEELLFGNIGSENAEEVLLFPGD